MAMAPWLCGGLQKKSFYGETSGTISYEFGERVYVILRNDIKLLTTGLSCR